MSKTPNPTKTPKPTKAPNPTETPNQDSSERRITLRVLRTKDDTNEAFRRATAYEGAFPLPDPHLLDMQYFKFENYLALHTPPEAFENDVKRVQRYIEESFRYASAYEGPVPPPANAARPELAQRYQELTQRYQAYLALFTVGNHEASGSSSDDDEGSNNPGCSSDEMTNCLGVAWSPKKILAVAGGGVAVGGVACLLHKNDYFRSTEKDPEDKSTKPADTSSTGNAPQEITKKQETENIDAPPTAETQNITGSSLVTQGCAKGKWTSCAGAGNIAFDSIELQKVLLGNGLEKYPNPSSEVGCDGKKRNVNIETECVLYKDVYKNGDWIVKEEMKLKYGNPDKKKILKLECAKEDGKDVLALTMKLITGHYDTNRVLGSKLDVKEVEWKCTTAPP